MAGPTGNPFAANRHADVLNENPTDEAAKLRLVEEVKNRAKGAFTQKDMPSAELLYGKAISLQESLGGKAEAALYSNRSMVRLNLNKVEGALDDANKCIAVDAKFVKAYHRKAQALVRLSEWDDAIAAAEAGAKLDPENKAFAELIEKAQKDKEKDKEDKAKLKSDAQDARVVLHNASTARTPAVKKPAAEGDDSSMRGYKKTADGKTTSYFHTEISDEAKELIAKQGFGKPQKLDTPVEDKEAKGGGSSWNQAGTYEEKNMIKWVEERLKTTCVGLSFAVPNGAGGEIVTKAVENITGDANISVSRGKRRRLLDLSFDVTYEASIGGEKGKGKLCLSEVSAGDGDEPEVNPEIDSSTPPGVREVLKAFVNNAGQGLQPLVIKAIKDLIAEYKEK
eukprot:TRINITY_DN4117_c0_g1_i1.p1 TRINITY_DN4117_c0_g1~~TRINITY_DN4117_c0_g1_i1.p1  ORF type:complete len:395 (+),score=129.34 TRINITY_DN4117_c0_g1_i1:77-1261(+)